MGVFLAVSGKVRGKFCVVLGAVRLVDLCLIECFLQRHGLYVCFVWWCHLERNHRHSHGCLTFSVCVRSEEGRGREGGRGEREGRYIQERMAE